MTDRTTDHNDPNVEIIEGAHPLDAGLLEAHPLDPSLLEAHPLDPSLLEARPLGGLAEELAERWDTEKGTP